MNLEELFRTGQREKVREAFALSPPQSPDDWLLLGRSEMADGAVERAMECFAEGLRQAPDHLGLHYYSACAHARKRQWYQVEQALAACIGQERWSRQALATRGQARISARLWDDALADYLELQRQYPLSRSDRVALAACLTQAYRWAEARSVIDPVLADGRGPEVAWLLQGRSCEGLGLWSEAAEVYRRGLQQYPESRALALQLLATGRRRQARRPQWPLHTLPTRQTLLDTWRQRRLADPAEFRCAHRIALLACHGARKLAALDRAEPARRLWQISLMHWCFLVDHEAWKAWFLDERGAAYGHAVTDDQAEQFSQELHRYLESLVEWARGARPRPGETSLQEEAARELRAGQACRQLLPGGGLALPGASGTVACGPQMLAWLDCAQPLSELLPRGPVGRGATDWWSWPDPEGTDDGEVELRRMFSTLGYVQMHLERNEPQRALESLRLATCPRCSGSVKPERARQVTACLADCSEFAQRHRGLADLPDRGERLLRWAQWLQLQALVAAAAAELALAEPRVETATEHWRTALELLDAGPRREILLRHLTEFAKERAAHLQSAGHAEAAVRLIEGAAACLKCGEELEGVLAQALTDRGIDLAKAGDPRTGAGHLRRALEFNPGIRRAQVSLVRVLHAAALAAARAKRFAEALEHLAEADEVLRRFADAASDRADLKEETLLVRLNVLESEAVHHYGEGDWEKAASGLEQALALAHCAASEAEVSPAVAGRAEQIRENLIVMYRRAGENAEGKGDAAERQRWLLRAERLRGGLS